MTLEEEFLSVFAVKDGVFKSEKQPSGEDSFISNLKINEKVINGGTSLVTFNSSEELSDLYVGIRSFDKGYFECPINLSSRIGGTYEYEMSILLSQELSESFAISLSASSKSGKMNKIVNSETVSVVTVATGKLQLSLSWDKNDDVDLYLFEPDGNAIYYGNPLSSDNVDDIIKFYCYLIEKYTNHSTKGLNFNDEDDLDTLFDYFLDIPDTVDFSKEIKDYTDKNGGIRGFLDLDSNAGCDIDKINNENITYPSKVKDGVYTVKVDLFEKCNTSTAGAKYVVTLNYDGKFVNFSSKQSGSFSDSNQGSYGESLVTIGSFRISNGKIEASEARSMEVRSVVARSPIVDKFMKKIKKK